MTIGPRVLKTGLAVTVAIFVCRVFQMEPASFAAITTVINMQPSVRKSMKNAWEQTIVHITAVILAIILGLILGNAPWVIGLAVVLMILISNRVGWQDAVIPGIVSIIFVLDAPSHEFLSHAGVRSLGIFLGLGIALLINRILAPPKYKLILKQQLQELFSESSAYFLESLQTFVSASKLDSFNDSPRSELEEKLQNVVLTYEYARDEMTLKDNSLLFERLKALCRGFIERGYIIESMAKERKERRYSPNTPIPPEHLSNEFQKILDLLLVGRDKVSVLKDYVISGFNEEHSLWPEENDTAYWLEFDQAISDWHSQSEVCGEFYLRAMMEVAVVATEIRWALRRLRMIYNLGSFK